MQHPDIWQLLQRIAHPDQPFVTVISESGRVELSGRTLVNGITKSANAFRDVLDTDPGDSVMVNLGWSWQQSVWQGAALVAGLNLEHTHTTNTDALVIDSSLISTHPLGLPAGGAHEITQDVLGQPDAWMYPGYFADQHALIESTNEWALNHGVVKSDRIGIVHGGQTDSDVFFYGPFLLPLIMCGSVVFILSPSEAGGEASDQVEALIRQEKITRLLQP